MRVTVDTTEDSPEQIRKIIRILQREIGEESSLQEEVPGRAERGGYQDVFSNPSPGLEAGEPAVEREPEPPQNAFSAIFGGGSGGASASLGEESEPSLSEPKKEKKVSKEILNQVRTYY